MAYLIFNNQLAADSFRVACLRRAQHQKNIETTAVERYGRVSLDPDPQKASFQQELAPSELEPVSGGPGFSESVSAMRLSL